MNHRTESYNPTVVINYSYTIDLFSKFHIHIKLVRFIAHETFLSYKQCSIKCVYFRTSTGAPSDGVVSPTVEHIDPEYQFIRLEDMEIVATLGMGGFGRVELVGAQLVIINCNYNYILPKVNTDYIRQAQVMKF